MNFIKKRERSELEASSTSHLKWTYTKDIYKKVISNIGTEILFFQSNGHNYVKK